MQCRQLLALLIRWSQVRIPHGLPKNSAAANEGVTSDRDAFFVSRASPFSADV